MNKIFTLLLVILSTSLFAQKDPTAKARPIVEEGKRLYKLEMASWHGTDLFLEVYKDRSNIGGYFSYMDHDIAKCIFFSKSDNPKVIGTISFDSSYNTATAVKDLSERAFSSIEQDLFMIRQDALNSVKLDPFFKRYINTNFNLIPLIHGKERKVYILTAPQNNGHVIFGNDYLLTYDKNNMLVGKKQLHQNIIPVEYGDTADSEKRVVGTIHSHTVETGDFITATDICTLMLYEKQAGWETHHVASKKYLNIWNCQKDELTVISMKVIDKINKDQKNHGEDKNPENSSPN